ncbi:MAG: succinate dehydrogenase, hydrophobic membrane anchor protein, partial [Caulobacteraceae bacterium]|nr:succinate dehydrogenase, hydrophobic membrane anchor protein [Caulobacteraceae bacterium]
MADYRTPLGRARGLGSAKRGVGDFIGQRVSALALLFLGLWGVWSALALAGGGYAGALAWAASPVDAAVLVLLTLAGFYHARIGMRT